jgi:hypothetical protein
MDKIDIEAEVRELLARHGEVRDASGILAVKLPDGTIWDMTVPMVVPETPAFPKEWPVDKTVELVGDFWSAT